MVKAYFLDDRKEHLNQSLTGSIRKLVNVVQRLVVNIKLSKCKLFKTLGKPFQKLRVSHVNCPILKGLSILNPGLINMNSCQIGINVSISTVLY